MRGQISNLALWLIVALLSSWTFAEVCHQPYAQTTDEGSFYLPEGNLRIDVTEGEPGLPVQLLVKVLDGGDCNPIDNAFVDIWHANAEGVYSGFAEHDSGSADQPDQDPHARGPAIGPDAGVPMIGAPAHDHMHMPLANRMGAQGAQGPESGAEHGHHAHPQGHRRHLKAQDDFHPEAGNDTHPGAAGIQPPMYPMPAMGPHAVQQLQEPRMASAPGLHAAGPRPMTEPEHGETHGRSLAAGDGVDGRSGQSGVADPPHGAHDGLPDVGPPMEGHPGRFPGAPHGMHGPHPIRDMGAPASARPEQFAGSPSKGRPHPNGAHGPHAMPGTERGPDENQSSPHEKRRGLAAEDEQPPRDAEGGVASGMTHQSAGGQPQEQGPAATRPGRGPNADPWAAAAKSSIRGPQPRKVPLDFGHLPAPAGVPHMGPREGHHHGPMGGPGSRPHMGPHGGQGPRLHPTDNSTFLRGVQATNASGFAVFQTIFPGPAPHEPPHINVKVHLPQGAAANLQQAFSRSLTVYTGQILVNHSLADAVYSANDAYSTSSRSHPPAPEDSDKHGPVPDAFLSQVATISGSVQSGLVLSITLKVHNTSEPAGELLAMGPASLGHFPGYPDTPNGMGAGDAHQTGHDNPRAMTPGSGPQNGGHPGESSQGRAMGSASQGHFPEVPNGMSAGDAHQTGHANPGAMTPGSAPQNGVLPDDSSQGSTESARDLSGATGPSMRFQGASDGFPEPPANGQAMMADQAGSQNPSMDGSAMHAMAPSEKDDMMPGGAGGMP